MITKEKSQKMKQLKYLLIIPLLMTMLFYASCANDVQSDIESTEKILEEGNIPSEGKYLRAKNGMIWFFGTHLDGEVVSPEEYTDKEKEIIDIFLTKPGTKIDKSIVIDENGERVYFINTDKSIKESDKQGEIIEVVEKEVIDDGSMPFAIIEEVPVYPGCEGSKAQLRACLQDKITKHINKSFNADLASGLGLSPGVKRIFVMFKIDKEGNIADIEARAPHNVLQEEAIRVINLLPKMTPGKHEGKPVGVKYSLPIAFIVEDDVKTKNVKTYKKGEAVPFAIIDEVPVYPGCEGNKARLRACTQEKITKHINKNFNADLATELNLSPGVKRISVMFKIDKEGNISDVSAKAPHKDLQAEAIRVVKALPKMTPGKHEGIAVEVKYSLPIAFKVE